MGVLLAIIIALHNFPEGFATFISTLSDFSFGLVIALAVMIHNIPEGMMVSLPIYHSTGSKKKAFMYATLSGLSEPLGALVCAFALYERNRASGDFCACGGDNGVYFF